MKRNAPITLAHVSALSAVPAIANAFANPKAATAPSNDTPPPAPDASGGPTGDASTRPPPAANDTPKPAADADKPRVTAVSLDIPLPTRSGNARGSKSLFDFSVLTQVGASIGIFGKTVKQMNSIVRNFNTKSDNREAVTDANGAPTYEMTEIKAADGSVVNRVPDTTKPITRPIVELIVTATDPKKDRDGAPLRVFRKR